LLRTENTVGEYPIEEQNWAVAAEFADSVGVDMISSSLGYDSFDDAAFNHSYAQRNGNTALVTIAADLAAKKGILVVNSAGNNGASTTESRFVSCPADGDSVFTVGSVSADSSIFNTSSWGPNGAGLLKPNAVSLGGAGNRKFARYNPSRDGFRVANTVNAVWLIQPGRAHRELANDACGPFRLFGGCHWVSRRPILNFHS
jgi:hypothetical protein